MLEFPLSIYLPRDNTLISNTAPPTINQKKKKRKWASLYEKWFCRTCHALFLQYCVHLLPLRVIHAVIRHLLLWFSMTTIICEGAFLQNVYNGRCEVDEQWGRFSKFYEGAVVCLECEFSFCVTRATFFRVFEDHNVLTVRGYTDIDVSQSCHHVITVTIMVGIFT